MPKPHTRHRPSRRRNPQRDACTTLLSRLTALEATLLKQSGPRGLAEAPAALARLTADLIAETRALLPGRARKAALPRLRPGHPVAQAELCVIAGQARVLLAAFVSMRGFDKPPARSNPRVEALRKKLADRIKVIREEADRIERARAASVETPPQDEGATRDAACATPSS